MKRSLVLVLLILCAATPGATAATNEIRFCGTETALGFQIAAGFYPPKIPFTTCRFARAAYKKAVRIGYGMRPRNRFSIRVRGQWLRCRVFIRYDPKYESLTCKNRKRYMVAFAYD